MKQTILLVDDDRSVRESLSKALRSEDYEVVVAANGQEALDKFNERIDLVLLDLRMPVLSGWDTFDLLHASNPFVPVVIITAATNHYQQQQAAGVVALVPKPVEVLVLLQTMKQVLAEEPETRRRRSQSTKSYFRLTHPLIMPGPRLTTPRGERSLGKHPARNHGSPPDRSPHDFPERVRTETRVLS